MAERFGVARSTVYAHWQEWGGYKLGESAKAPIRFARADLALGRSAKQPTDPPPTKRRPTRRRRRRRADYRRARGSISGPRSSIVVVPPAQRQITATAAPTARSRMRCGSVSEASTTESARQHSTRVGTRRGSRRPGGSRLAKIELGLWSPSAGSDGSTYDAEPTFRELATDWLDARKQNPAIGSRTTELNEWQLRRYLAPFFGDLLPSQITPDKVKQYRRRIHAENAHIRAAADAGRTLARSTEQASRLRTLSNESINKTLRTLAAILDEAEDVGFVTGTSHEVDAHASRLSAGGPAASSRSTSSSRCSTPPSSSIASDIDLRPSNAPPR